MKGIRAFSNSLSAYVDKLPEEKLKDVIREALALCKQEHSSAFPICEAIDRFTSGQISDNSYSDRLLALSNEYDSRYIELEKAGAIVESQTTFRRMCMANALHRLFSSQSITLDVVDDSLYDIAASFNNFKQFGVDLETCVRSMCGDS